MQGPANRPSTQTTAPAALLAFVRRRRRGLAVACVCAGSAAFLLWLWCFLRPDTWRYYTDETTFRQLARDVSPRYLAWEDAQPVQADLDGAADAASETEFSPDGTRMVFVRGAAGGDANLYIATWDGTRWSGAAPLRALNSRFNERSPCFSRDGAFLYFATDRPGGPGGYDIWVARWDGAEFAWPVPLTLQVNSKFDDLGPAVSGDDTRLFFSSSQPRRPLTKEEEALDDAALRGRFASLDHDLYAADRVPAGVTNCEVERAMSMLYYLRSGALSNPDVMARLGGSADTEKAVDRALDWLARAQETNGWWSIARTGGQAGHDVAATAFALLAFFGRGERHDRPGPHADTVRRGVAALLRAQNRLTGDLRGTNPQQNAMYDHSIGTLALAEAYGLTKHEDLFLPAQSAIDFLADAQNPDDGGWRYRPRDAGDLSVSGWAIMALRSAELTGLHVPRKTIEGARAWIKAVSSGAAGGIYSYQPKGGRGSAAMLATGWFCSQLLGLSPNTPRAFETMRNLAETGVRVSDIYYAYYGTLSAYQSQGPLWRDWNPKLHQALLASQDSDGSWAFQDSHAKSMGRAICTALAALSLQAHYRYTPLYGLGYDPPPRPERYSSLSEEDLPEVPLYRRAKHLAALSSDGQDVQPAVPAHGDYLYFASDRAGGSGGLDLYRSRIAGGTARLPVNLGAAVNSAADETDPAVRMAGFELTFRTAREPAGLYRSVSREIFRRHAQGALPAARWMLSAFGWRLALAGVALAGFVFFVLRGPRRACSDAARSPSAGTAPV